MRTLGLLTTVLLSVSCLAADQSPYAGQERRAIKSFSAGEIADLRAGAGMGFAKLAELNGYPGPKHVLELADELDLAPEQREATLALFDAMQEEAAALGEDLLDAEARLDQDFEAGTVSASSLQAALQEIASIRARLRYVHLEAHLQQTSLLSAEQVAAYNRLRGYASHDHQHEGHAGRHH